MGAMGCPGNMASPKPLLDRSNSALMQTRWVCRRPQAACRGASPRTPPARGASHQWRAISLAAKLMAHEPLKRELGTGMFEKARLLDVLMSDVEYRSVQVIADQAFDRYSTDLSKALKTAIEGYAARGFSNLGGPAIRVMADATVKAVRGASDGLLSFYERAFSERPAVPPETVAAIQSQLAAHISGQMTSLVATYEGQVESHGGGSASDPEMRQLLNSTRHQIEARVAALIAKLG